MTTQKAAGAGPRASDPAAWRNLAYATMSMALGFAAWGLISAFAPTFRAQFNLSAQSTAFLVAVPVLLGSLARLPIGMLTDRIGGRVVFTGLFLFVAGAAALVPRAATYDSLLVSGFLLGVAGASFAVGVGFASRWFPPESQGTALGIYGLGNMGHSAAVFLGPVVAAWYGRDAVFLRRRHPLCCLGRVLLHLRSRRSRDRSPVVNRRDDRASLRPSASPGHWRDSIS